MLIRKLVETKKMIAMITTVQCIWPPSNANLSAKGTMLEIAKLMAALGMIASAITVPAAMPTTTIPRKK